MGLMSGKRVVIFGVANKRSIAWGIARALQREGARLALNFQNERMEETVRKLAADLPEDTFLAPCDVTVEGDVERFFERLSKEAGPLDGLVHSIAFAKREELGGSFSDTSWEGYQISQKVSAWSLVALARGAAPLMEGREGSMVCLTYLGADRVVPNYNVMGVSKAALEACTRYLAHDLGPRGIRVNAISAGPIKTLSAMGVSDFSQVLDAIAERAPLRRNVDQIDVGNTAAFLLSDLARGITGQTIYVDAGYSIMGT
ncbi:MAG: enoyl-ACP reductase FabI [Planctomycetota bacterium]